MPKVTAELTKVVWVSIKGENQSGCHFPKMPDDGGLCKRFRQWADENNIQYAITAGGSGGGYLAGGFWPKDMGKIVDWLQSNGVDCCQYTNE